MFSSWNIVLNIAIIFGVLFRELLTYFAKYPSDTGRFSFLHTKKQSTQKPVTLTTATQRPNFFSPMKLFNRKPLRPEVPKKEFLTKEEFEVQGKI